MHKLRLPHRKWGEQRTGGTAQTFLAGFVEEKKPYDLYDQGVAGSNAICHYKQGTNGLYSRDDEYVGNATNSTGNFNFSDKFDGFKVAKYTTRDEGFKENGGTRTVSAGQSASVTYPIYVYHERQKYMISYYSDGAEVYNTGEKSIFFEAPLADYNYTLEQVGLEERDHYVFTGWYADSEKDAERVAEATEYEAPAITRDAVDQKVINLYAGFEEIKKDEPAVTPEKNVEPEATPAAPAKPEKSKTPKAAPDKTPKAAMQIAEATTIVEEAVPTTAPTAEMVNIADDKTPLAQGTWALINLIAAIVTALGAMVAIFRRKEEEDEEDMYKAEDEDDSRSKKMFAAKAAGTLAGIAAVITFLLTEDMSLPMAMIDKWTVLMVIMLAVQIIAAAFNKKASEIDDEQEAAEEAAN